MKVSYKVVYKKTGEDITHKEDWVLTPEGKLVYLTYDDMVEDPSVKAVFSLDKDERCENCIFFTRAIGNGHNFCTHERHDEAVVADFTSCPDFEKAELLAPCPFCGGEAEIIIKDWDNRADEYMVQCTKCGVRQKDYYISRDAVILAWNRGRKKHEL